MNISILYNKIKINLIRGENIRQAILSLKKTFTYSEFQQCIKIMANSRFYKETMMSIICVRKCSDLISEGMFPMLLEKDKINTNIELQVKEFEFFAAFLSCYSKKLKDFNILRKEFEQSLLYGKFEKAEAVLDAIQEQFGMSYWYLESKMLLLYVWKKMNEFREFYENVKAEADHEIVKTYIRILKRKVTLSVSNNEYIDFYKKHIKNLLEHYPDEKEMLSYMEFMSYYSMKDISQSEDYILQHLLIISQHLALVDQYLLFCKMDINLRIQPKIDRVDKNEILFMLQAADKFRKEMNLLVWSVNQEQIQWGSDLSVEYIRNHVNMEFEIRNKQMFLEGKYDICVAACQNALKEDIQFNTLRLLVQAYVASNTNLDGLPEKTMMDILVKRMCKMYVKTTNILQIEMWQELPRFFMSCSFGVELLEFVYNRLYASSEFEVIKCLYASLYSQDYISLEHMIILKESDREGFLNAWTKAVGKCSLCIWSENICELLREYKNINWDRVSVQLFQMLEENQDARKLRMNQLANASTNLEIFFREEYGVSIFNRAVVERDFRTAFRIYVEMFFTSELSVMRMNTKALNRKLHGGNCRLFYEEVDFCVYACNTELHYINANIPSEFVRNSFRKILKIHGVNRPSLLKIPEDFLECWKVSYFLYYVCDLRMLATAIDLYDLDAIEERRKILMMVRDKYDCDSELKSLDEEEIRISMLSDSTESMQMKAICASWIKVSDENFILRAMQEMKEQGVEYLSVFRNLIINCKELYIIAVNEKLGTTIRHCILESIVLGTLTDYKVYVSNKTTLPQLLEIISALDKYDEVKKYEVLHALCDFFDNFFLEIDAVRKNIYFTDQEHEEKIRFYVPDNIIEEGARKVSEVKTCAELHKLVMDTFHRNLERQIKELGKSVIRQLQEGYNNKIKILLKKLEEVPEMKDYLKVLDEAVKLALQETEQMFVVTYNENEKHLLSSYIKMINNKFTYILIENICRSELKVRNEIVWSIDIILKNCIENVERHAEIPIEKSNFKILIQEIDGNTIELTFCNIISADIDRKSLKETIDSINKNIMQKVYIDKKTEDDKHGMGYYRIAQFLHNNIGEIWNLHLSLNDDIFSAIVSFELEGNDESIDC